MEVQSTDIKDALLGSQKKKKKKIRSWEGTVMHVHRLCIQTGHINSMPAEDNMRSNERNLKQADHSTETHLMNNEEFLEENFIFNVS